MVIKGYKVTDVKYENKYGIGCHDFKDLKEKGCFKLGIEEENVRIQLMDGTIVDETYFDTLPSQTLFVFLRPGESLPTGAEVIYEALKKVNLSVLKSQPDIIEFLHKEDVSSKLQNILKLLNDTSASIIHSEQIFASLRKDDPKWFEGLETRCSTKEDFMYRRAQERIRGYFYKTKCEIIKSQNYLNFKQCKMKLDKLIKDFSEFLKLCDYNGKYFDRRCKILCTKRGDFQCQGKWNSKCCKYDNEHIINPYLSRELRVLFSTWNLDHRIERSRTILPAILEASQMDGQINSEYFAKLLFTLDNLKLVHIICHDKNGHEGALCTPGQYTLGG